MQPNARPAASPPTRAPHRHPVAMLLFSLVLFGISGCGDGDTDKPQSDISESDVNSPQNDSAASDASSDTTFVNPIDLSCLEMVPLRLWTTDPSAVAMLYRLETCEGETVVLEPRVGESVFDYYTLTENGQALSSEAVPAIERSERQRAYVTLLLDFSASTQSVEAELLTSAQAFAERLLTASDRIWVGVEIFDGRATPVTVLRPTPSLSEVRSAISGLAGHRDPAADAGSTNLNGAVEASVRGLQAWQDAVMSRNDAGVVTTGYLVTFTDGRDTSERVLRSAAESTVAAGRSASAGDGGANVQTYAVALKGLDYTAEARQDLLAIIGGDERWLYEGTLNELDSRFTELAGRIANQVEATHLLKYCSAARAGSRRVELGIKASIGAASRNLGFEFSADGFSGGCVEFIRTICVDRECGGFNCGGCDDRTEQCDGEIGRCLSECLVENKCQSEVITTQMGYRNVCTPEVLGTDVAQCGTTCVDRGWDDRHCGACGAACKASEGETCEDGACSCPGGLMRCEGECQTATWFEDNNAHCGVCGHACRAGEGCEDAECRCLPGFIASPAGCVDVDACIDHPCARGISCVDSAAPAPNTRAGRRCQCPDGFAYDESNGCNDLDECLAGVAGCSVNATCENFDGGYRCICPDGTIDANGNGTLCLNVTQLSAGWGHTCAIAGVGGTSWLFCWGGNTNGQLGDGTTTDRMTPTRIGADTNWTEVSAGDSSTCGRRGGELYCWGQNWRGVLGDGTTEPRLTPTRIGTDSDWTEVSTAGTTTCGRRGGELYCWGANSSGEVGDGTQTDRYVPTRVGESSDWSRVVRSGNRTCGLRAGALYCWGWWGSTTYRTRPQQIGTGTDWEEISRGQCGRRGGIAYCWDNSGAPSPEKIGVWADWGTVDGRCGIRGGQLYCWGSNNYGQLGNGTTDHSSAPVQVGTDVDWTEVRSGTGGHTCGRRGGLVFCWGRNGYGQLGLGFRTDNTIPSPVGTHQDWTQVAVGRTSSTSNEDITIYGIRAGMLYTWGLSPIRVGTDSDWSQVSAGFRYACGRRGGEIHCWGTNQYGRLGNGTASTSTGGLVGTENDWNDIAAGSYSTCGIRAGELYCWGRSPIGDGTTTDRLTPTRIGTDANWSGLSVGERHICGLRDGELYCWGENTNGQLGDGTLTQRLAPTRIGTDTDWTEISAGAHTCGRRGGQLFCWGANTQGQLGDGTGTRRLVPTAVSGNDWSAVSAGTTRTCGLRGDRLFCWGERLQTTPEAVDPHPGWAEIATTALPYTCGRRAGEILCWGGSEANIGTWVLEPRPVVF